MGTLMKSWLGIPQHLKIYDMVPIGYAVKQPRRRPAAPWQKWCIGKPMTRPGCAATPTSGSS